MQPHRALYAAAQRPQMIRGGMGEGITINNKPSTSTQLLSDRQIIRDWGGRKVWVLVSSDNNKSTGGKQYVKKPDTCPDKLNVVGIGILNNLIN